jgi:hypothetical protein
MDSGNLKLEFYLEKVLHRIAEAIEPKRSKKPSMWIDLLNQVKARREQYMSHATHMKTRHDKVTPQLNQPALMPFASYLDFPSSYAMQEDEFFGNDMAGEDIFESWMSEDASGNEVAGEYSAHAKDL